MYPPRHESLLHPSQRDGQPEDQLDVAGPARMGGKATVGATSQATENQGNPEDGAPPSFGLGDGIAKGVSCNHVEQSRTTTGVWGPLHETSVGFAGSAANQALPKPMNELS